MGMGGRIPLGCAGLDLIAPIGQHVSDVRVFAGAQAEGDGAGRLQPGLAIAFGEGQQAKASAVGVLGVALALQHLGNHARTGHPDTFSPGDEALRRPLGVGLVGQGQMLDHSRVATLVGTAHVAGKVAFPGRVLILSPIVGESFDAVSGQSFVPPRAGELHKLASTGAYPRPKACEVHVGKDDWQSNPARVCLFAQPLGIPVEVLKGQGHMLDKDYVARVLDVWLANVQ